MDKKQQFEQKQKDKAGRIPSFEEMQATKIDGKPRISKATGQGYDLANGPDKQVELEVNGETGEIVGMTEELPEMADKEVLMQLVEEKYKPILAIMNLPDDKLCRILDDIEEYDTMQARYTKLETFCENMIETVQELLGKDSAVLQSWRLAMDKYYEDFEVERKNEFFEGIKKGLKCAIDELREELSFDFDYYEIRGLVHHLEKGGVVSGSPAMTALNKLKKALGGTESCKK